MKGNGVTLPQVACVNCHLFTRADQTMCLHGNHRRDRKMALETRGDVQQPTAEDREAYFLWLSQKGVHALQ